MRITNNLSALSAYNSLNLTNASLQRVIHGLSTGLRINSSSDDAAGFAISEKMRSQIRGLDVALRNSQDGISLLHTAEGALEQTNSMLSRMRELAVQASNDSLTSNDRQYIQLEIEQLKDQIDRIAETTQFNKKRLLDGSCGAIWTSSDLNVKVKINGGLTYIDDYGQKVSMEGNYRIDVRAEAGEAQVQKSSIMNTSRQRMYTATVENLNPIDPIINIPAMPSPTNEINIETGLNTAGVSSGNGWTFSNGVLSITGDGVYNIVGTNTATRNRIEVREGVSASVFLTDVNINVSSQNYTSPFDIRGASVDLFLAGTNTLVSGYDASGVQVQNTNSTSNASLSINSASGFRETDGVLNATCGSGCAAGIGGACYTSLGRSPNGWRGSVGKITINGGTINSTANGPGAGIGGGGWYSGAPEGIGAKVNITINGGNITATAMGDGAGIGSGGVAKRDTLGVDKITITGGNITATANGNGAAIGGGYLGNSGEIIIPDSIRENLTLRGWIDTENGAELPIGRGLDGIFQGRQDENNYEEDVVEVSEKILADIQTFYNSDGVFLVRQPQTLTITQGDGQTASITLYETDTMYDVAEKINDVIANTFGNSRYTDNISKFCTISDGTEGTSESIFIENPIYSNEIYKRDENGELVLDDNGDPITLSFEERLEYHEIYKTMLVRSAIPGKAGELYFSGDEDLLKALGLNTIRESSETRYTASIYNAHSGKVIANGIRTTGNALNGIIQNVDIEFDSMAGIKSEWDEATKRYIFNDDETYSAYIHLTDNSATFQTGANQGEDFMIQLSDTSSNALGISSVTVVTRETASRSISIIDSAINKISSQRAKIGSYENALEHTMTNLTTTSTNLSSAESRIRDADMSKLMMDFVKLQILNQSGTSMLAQANQLPQSILSLMQ